MSKKNLAWHSRFWSKVDKRGPSECWNWLASKSPLGYGCFDKRGAHRVAYEALRGAVPVGLVLDHLCRNPGCVNPAHLEAVTHRENIRRGVRFWQKCPHGDAFRYARNRTCQACANTRRRELYAQKKAA